MQKADIVLSILRKKSKNDEQYKYDRIYRNFFNRDLYLRAYSKIYAKEGNMTAGTDGKTIDGFSKKNIESLIANGIQTIFYPCVPYSRKEYKGEPEPIGAGQLIHHIDSIEADNFQWDSNIPDEVIYYPLLVFEDVKLVQKGILSIVNRWFNEEVEKQKELDLRDISCRPVMVVSINTLYLYDKLLLKKGLTKVIDSFLKDNAVYDNCTGVYNLLETADFDEYLRKNPFHKAGDAVNWIKEMINNRTSSCLSDDER